MAEQIGFYDALGVSAGKEDVHAATRNLDEGLFPGAFCRIFPDIAGDPKWCTVPHADGIGTKLAAAYLVWLTAQRSKNDAICKASINVWKKIAQCGIVMNCDDMGCVGAVNGPFMILGLIDRNACLIDPQDGESKVIPASIIADMINGAKEFCDLMTELGIPFIYGGGETADVGDLVRTITAGYTAFCRMKRSQVIDPGRITRDDVIIGFSSIGKANWENELNSGIGSNGLTGARHGVFSSGYREFTETYAPETPINLIYRGGHSLADLLPGDPHFSIGSALLSPTRTYLPLMREILGRFMPDEIHAFIHCTGGGQTKIKRFGGPGLFYVKDNLFSMPPVFQMIQDSSGMSWKEMHEVFNVGHRLEVVVPRELTSSIMTISLQCGIDARVVGYVEKNKDQTKNAVRIISEHGTFDY